MIKTDSGLMLVYTFNGSEAKDEVILNDFKEAIKYLNIVSK